MNNIINILRDEMVKAIENFSYILKDYEELFGDQSNKTIQLLSDSIVQLIYNPLENDVHDLSTVPEFRVNLLAIFDPQMYYAIRHIIALSMIAKYLAILYTNDEIYQTAIFIELQTLNLLLNKMGYSSDIIYFDDISEFLCDA